MEKYIKDYILSQPSQYISFEQFMALSLYHPALGYYNQTATKIGKKGDFYTNSNIGDVFGRTLGRLFLYIFEKFRITPCIIELGGGIGRIARAILQYLEAQNQGLFSHVSYILVESSKYHQQWQRKVLASFNNISYRNDLTDAHKIKGIVFSNEFFDAFPVHVIEKINGHLYEVMVTVLNDAFEEKLVPLENEEIFSYLSKQQMTIKEGQRIEIPLPMMRYYKQLCEKIEQGVLLTIDYGYTNKEWAEAIHRQGSLRGYRQHRMTTNVLRNPGRMDLTTHIHWDALQHDTFQTHRLIPQTEFLLYSGILEEWKHTDSADPFSVEQKRNRAIRTFLEPGQISGSFQALLQTKQMDCFTQSIFPYERE